MPLTAALRQVGGLSVLGVRVRDPDLAWLRAMGGKVGEMPIQELVHIACAGPFASGLFDEAELKPYLAGREPQVCK